MLKKIVFTALVILLVYLVVRWRQKRAQQVAAVGQSTQKKAQSIYFLAGSVVTLMAVSIIFWLATQ
jgi:hypothetical protein